MMDEVAQQHPDNVGPAAQIIGHEEVVEGQPQTVDLGGDDNERHYGTSTIICSATRSG